MTNCSAVSVPIHTSSSTTEDATEACNIERSSNLPAPLWACAVGGPSSLGFSRPSCASLLWVCLASALLSSLGPCWGSLGSLGLSGAFWASLGLLARRPRQHLEKIARASVIILSPAAGETVSLKNRARQRHHSQPGGGDHGGFPGLLLLLFLRPRLLLPLGGGANSRAAEALIWHPHRGRKLQTETKRLRLKTMRAHACFIVVTLSARHGSVTTYMNQYFLT